MREIVYSRCSEMRILATAGILIRCERRETTTPIHWFYHLCLSRSHPIQLGNVFSGDQNRLPSEIWISQSRNFFDPENIWAETSVELRQTVPPNLDSRPLDLDPDSFVCSDMLGTQPEESHLPLSVFWPKCYFCLFFCDFRSTRTLPNFPLSSVRSFTLVILVNVVTPDFLFRNRIVFLVQYH